MFLRKAIPFFLLMLSMMVPLAAFDTSCCSPCYRWTGLYVGGFVGGAWGNKVVAKERPPFNPGTESWDNDLGSSWIGSGVIGYNYHCGCWLFGIEDEVGYINLEGRAADPNSAGAVTPGASDRATIARIKIGSWYDMLALRFGYTHNCFLIYAKAGVALTRISGRVDDTFLSAFPVHASGYKYTKPWVAGGGLEYGFCKRWSARAEYLYFNIHDEVTSGFNTPGLTPGGWRHEFHGVHTAKFGINYRFSLGCGCF